MLNKINAALITADRISDYIPVVSTFTNLTDLFIKCVILPLTSESTIKSNNYLNYINNKPSSRCVILLVPGFGNLLIGLADYFSGNLNRLAHKLKLDSVKENGLTLKSASKRLKNDRAVVTAAVQQNGLALEYASTGLKNDRAVVTAAVQQNGKALSHASTALKDDYEVVLAAVRNDGNALLFASARLKNNKEIVLAALGHKPHDPEAHVGLAEFEHAAEPDASAKHDGLAYVYASDDLKMDKEVVIAAVSKKASLFSTDMPRSFRSDRDVILAAATNGFGFLRHVNTEILEDKTFVLQLVALNGFALHYASDVLKDDEEVVQAAIRQNPEARESASIRLQNQFASSPSDGSSISEKSA